MQDVWPNTLKATIHFFKPSEFGYTKGDEEARIKEGRKMSPQFIIKLDLLRARIGRPLKINSGYRSKAHNASVKGSANSPHLLGRAADISTVGWQPWQRKQFVAEARTLGFMGVGIGRTYIHLDDVTSKDGPYTRPLTWTYGAGNKSVAHGNDVPESAW